MHQKKRDILKEMIILKKDHDRLLYILGSIPVVWISLLVAPSINGGLSKVIKEFSKIMENPFYIKCVVNQ